MYSFFVLHFLLVLVINEPFRVLMKRGPHHPKSELSHSKTEVDQHLRVEEHHIEDDLQKLGLNVNLEEMTEEEKNFYFFKIHDSDNNNALDGLEMLQAALHQNNKFEKADRDTFIQNVTEELNHIIDVIDEFIYMADLNMDGFLHYPEYMRAINENKFEDIRNEKLY